jgi:hypothetical protein
VPSQYFSYATGRFHFAQAPKSSRTQPALLANAVLDARPFGELMKQVSPARWALDLEPGFKRLRQFLSDLGERVEAALAAFTSTSRIR